MAESDPDMYTGGASFGRRAFLRTAVGLAASLPGLAVLSGGCGLPLAPRGSLRPFRIGYLISSTVATNADSQIAFHKGLRDLGYVDGRDVVLEVRSSEARDDALPGLATELVNLGVDVIVISGNVALHAVQQVTPTVPIVFTVASDPVENGLVASLSKPGANATGLTQEAGTEAGKRMELLKTTVPNLSRVAALWSPVSERRFHETESVAQALGVDIVSLDLQRVEDIDATLSAVTASGADGMIVVGGPTLSALDVHLVEFAATNRLPAMYFFPAFAHVGGLMAYGPDTIESYRRAATYVDKILKGSKPADLPIERPRTFDFVVNLVTAHALGLSIPPDVASQVTEWVQ